MALSLLFPLRRRRGVSELYAAVLMIGVTLSIGSIVVVAATSQFDLASSSATLGASLREGAAETQLGLVYAAVRPSASCPAYRGYQEGTDLTVALYDLGETGFAPAGFVVNGTDYVGSYSALSPGALGEYALALGSCAHPAGLTILAYDAQGDEVQFGT
ncbi:MAG: hypothetical protein JRN57_02595 [Nitrososphaerota archaeon]|nr:hypothetical protein [Nitrososphaerota archaeon]